MSLLDKFEKLVKIAPWLQFVGLALAAIALYFVPTVTIVAHVAKGVAVVGIFVSLAGFDYKKLYP